MNDDKKDFKLSVGDWATTVYFVWTRPPEEIIEERINTMAEYKDAKELLNKFTLNGKN